MFLNGNGCSVSLHASWNREDATVLYSREIPGVIVRSIKLYGLHNRHMIEENVIYNKLTEALQVRKMQFGGGSGLYKVAAMSLVQIQSGSKYNEFLIKNK